MLLQNLEAPFKRFKLALLKHSTGVEMLEYQRLGHVSKHKA